ncbi:MAG: PQQ-binding-like beta-propeller repeat protein [Candidatus Eremiobacteraeota bacterium]|nr:PQQ-binding-like beta-propeller repeat protein [Candidatus Eremiobacteraeota bacterium]
MSFVTLHCKRYFALAVFSVLSACGGGGGSQPATAPNSPLSPLQPSPNPPPAGNAAAWPMLDGNLQRNGYQSPIGISSVNASAIKLQWLDTFNAPIQASPLVSNGMVFVSLLTGDISAVDRQTGAVIWHYSSGSSIHGTPTIDGNTLIVPLYDTSGVLALDATTGAVLWKRVAADWGALGATRTAPLVANGVVYIASGWGDPDVGCHHGTMAAISESTGAILWTWATGPEGNGVNIWSPISLTPFGDIAFGTGNACVPNAPHMQSAVAVNATTGAFHWGTITSQGGSDIDVGGGIAEVRNSGFFTGKDGNLYAIDLGTGALQWKASLHAALGYGSIATPATDGNNVVSQSGALVDPGTTSTPSGNLYDFDVDGEVRWVVGPFTLEQFSSPAITSDIVVVGVDNTIQILSLESGSLLWSYNMGSFVYSSPALAAGSIFIASYGSASTGGSLAAFSLGASQPASKFSAGKPVVRRFINLPAHPVLRDWHPWGGH